MKKLKKCTSFEYVIPKNNVSNIVTIPTKISIKLGLTCTKLRTNNMMFMFLFLLDVSSDIFFIFYELTTCDFTEPTFILAQRKQN